MKEGEGTGLEQHGGSPSASLCAAPARAQPAHGSVLLPSYTELQSTRSPKTVLLCLKCLHK